MMNVMETIYFGAVARLTRWLRGNTLVACIGRSMGAMFLQRASSTFRTSSARLPPVGQQLLDSAVELRRQPGENVLEVGPRVMPAQLGRLQQAHHHCGALAGQLTAYKKPVAPTKAQGRIWLSMWLLSIGTAPSSRYRESPSQWFKL